MDGHTLASMAQLREVRDHSVTVAATTQPKKGSATFIEGGIGAGKTTVGKLLVWLASFTQLPLIFIDEPSNDPLLQEFILNKKTKAASFQKSMLRYRLEVLKMAVNLLNDGWLVVLDRSLYGDRVFEYINWKLGNMTNEEHFDYIVEFTKYKNQYNTLLENAQVAYIPQSEETMVERIKQRDRQGEVDGYHKDYLNLIRETYAK
jgi:deoxyadenosine/deoxycytidine kinase